MENIVQFLEANLPFLIDHKYLFIYLAVSIEGLNSTILAGFLASIGAVSLWPVILICIAAAMTNGFMWYIVGYYAGSKPIDRWGRKDERSRKIIKKVEDYFHRYSGRAIIIAKLTWSMAIATMITAGSLKYNFKKFIFYNFIGSVGWAFMVVFLGYFFGRSFGILANYFKDFILAIFLLAIAIAVAYLLKRKLGSLFIRYLTLKDQVRNISDRILWAIDKFLNGK